MLRNGRKVLDRVGDCEELLDVNGGRSIVVRDLVCPLDETGGGSLGMFVSSRTRGHGCVLAETESNILGSVTQRSRNVEKRKARSCLFLPLIETEKGPDQSTDST